MSTSFLRCSDNISDRYYVALYRKLGDPELKRSARQSMFLNLLFKSMKKDTCQRRVFAFIKRLLQVCSYQPPTFVCAALILLSEVSVVAWVDGSGDSVGRASNWQLEEPVFTYILLAAFQKLVNFFSYVLLVTM